MYKRKTRHAGWAVLCAVVCAMAMATVAAPVLAQIEQERSLSRKTTDQVFWRFAQCVVRREPRASADLLRRVYWTAKQIKTATDLAARNGDYCALVGGDVLKMQPVLFRSALASAAFVARHDKQPLPDYAAAPQRFGNIAIDTAGTPEDRNRAILLSFAECVFRNRAEDVRKLLVLEPMSPEEKAAWLPLNEILGGCLPATPGSQVRFTRMALRGLLGEAAYELDQVLAAVPPVTPTATR